MAEEEKGTSTDTENTDDAGSSGAADSQAGGASKETTEETNWEQRYKDLQAESTRTSQEASELRTRVQQLEQPPGSPEEEDDLGGDDEGFVDRKTVNKLIDSAVQKAVGQVRTQSANAYFRKTYPELVVYENAIAGIMRAPKKALKDGTTPEERIDAAVKEFKALTEEQVVKAKEDAEAAAKAQQEAKQKASGLGSSTTSTPAKGDEDVSDEQELKNRKAKSAKQRGLA